VPAEDGALALARTLAPADTLLAAELALGRDGFFGTVAKDPAFQDGEKRFPGLADAIWKAMEPELRSIVAQTTPQLWARLAATFRSQLSTSEIAGLRVFYASSTGQKMIATMYGNIDAAPIIEQVIASPDAPITSESFAASQEPAKRKIVQSIGPEDEPALLALQKTVTLEKMGRVGKEVQRITLEWVNEEDPIFDALVEKVIEAAAERHMNARSRRR
jgi:hypothetical protein